MFTSAALIGLLFFANPQASTPAQRIVSASNVRLRSAPQTTAEELARFSLGVILTELETSPDGMWLRVQTAEGKTGWVFVGLTHAWSGEPKVIHRRVIQSRLAIEDLSFSDATDLVDYVGRLSTTMSGPDRAEFDLFRLRALARAARHIDDDEPTDSYQRNWINGHDDELFFSEPGGQWFVNAKLYWELEEKHRGNSIADQIAWEGANAGVPGECEGYIPCTLAVLLMTVGHHLELYPSGAHGVEALQYIDSPLQEIVSPNTHYTMDRRESVELRDSIAKLSAIVERTSDPLKAEILARLKLVDQKYR